jgi:hypothetical protein
MRSALFGVAALGLAAGCGETGEKLANAAASATGRAAPICTAPLRREIALSAPDAKDVFEVSALGPDCEQAAIVVSVRTAVGVLLWTHSDVASQTMAFAGIEDSKETHELALQRHMKFISDQSEVSTTAQAPDWKEGAARPENETGLYFGTEFPRDLYISTRTEARPMLCHPIKVNAQQCIVLYTDGLFASSFYNLSS